MSMSELPANLQSLDNQAKDSLKSIHHLFQRVDKANDNARKAKLLDDITPKLREAKRIVQQFETELKETEGHYPAEVTRILHDKKKALVKELNCYVSMRKSFNTGLSQGQTVKLSADGRAAEVVVPSESIAGMSNEQVITRGKEILDETDRAVVRSRQVVENTINIGAQSATTLKGQTEQMERIADNLETLDFNLKQATKIIRRYGRQVATDKCILCLMGLLVLAIVAVIVVKIVNPKSGGGQIPGISGSPPPTARRLL